MLDMPFMEPEYHIIRALHRCGNTHLNAYHHSISTHSVGEKNVKVEYMLMSYIEGRDLLHVVREGPLPWKYALYIIIEVAK